MRLLFLLTFLLAITVVVDSTSAHAQSNGVTFFGHLNLPHGGEYSGCWGYTHPNGREYVLTGAYTGTAIVDITDSTNVHEVAFIPGPASLWHEIRTWGKYAYVVSEGGGGTQIIDLSNLPISATLVTSFTYTSGANNTSRSHTIEIFDGYMYLNGCANWTGSGIVIFNLNNPTAPGFEGVYTLRYVHDCYVRNDTIYAATINQGRSIDIINAAVKSNLQVIKRITYSGITPHNTWATKDGRYLISTDEVDAPENKRLKFWEIATLPANPPYTPSATYSYSPADIAHNVTVRGNYAYVAWYTAGLVVANISNPLSPATAGWYDTYPGTSGGYNGAWPVYPYFPSGKIAIADMTSGTWIFRFNNLLPRRSVRLFSPANGDSVFNIRTTRFRWTSAADMQADPHYHVLSMSGPGVSFTSNVNDTTFQSIFLSGFQAGQIYRWTVGTRDEVNNTASVDTFQFVYQPAIAHIATNADTLDFGQAIVDSTVSRALQITNTGTATLVISNIGPTSSVFASNFVGPVSVQPDSSYETMVSFTPPDSLSYEGALQIFTNAFQQPEKDVFLRGMGDFPTGVDDRLSVPLEYALKQNYPNPFNPTTTIAYVLSRAGPVTLKIFNVLGEEVETLVNEEEAAGAHTVSFNAQGLASGLYIYRLVTQDFMDVRKMVLLK